jgi:hypothetical protein
MLISRLMERGLLTLRVCLKWVSILINKRCVIMRQSHKAQKPLSLSHLQFKMENPINQNLGNRETLWLLKLKNKFKNLEFWRKVKIDKIQTSLKGNPNKRFLQSHLDLFSKLLDNRRTLFLQRPTLNQMLVPLKNLGLSLPRVKIWSCSLRHLPSYSQLRTKRWRWHPKNSAMVSKNH